MKQVVQRRGRFSVEEVPAPALPAGFVLVRTAASLLSPGTERAIARAARKGLIEKALERPDLVRQVLTRVAQDGLTATIDSVQGRLDEPTAVGYSASGTVLEVAGDKSTFRTGDRVACAGAGFANHAQIICVPRNLCAAVPTGVSLEHAAFATIGSIALHGVRLSRLEVGTNVAVIGLGLLGQLTAQIAIASGCRVLGIDLMPDRIALARQLGVDSGCTPDEGRAAARDLTRGIGMDAVLVAADTTSNDPIELAGELARDRATVVALGAVALNVPRDVYYRKELKVIVCRSYGPGRYDPAYEVEGHDYPIGYVRWTEHRNLDAFLDLVARNRVQVAPLITHRFPVTDAAAAYDLIGGVTGQPHLGVVLTYPDAPDVSRTLRRRVDSAPTGGRQNAEPRLGVLGAGSFAKSMLLPAFKAANARFAGIVSQQGLSAKACAERFGFDYFGTDESRVVTDPTVDVVVIATRHHLHARQAIAAAQSHKDVFVEKPLCTTPDELDEVERVFSTPSAPRLMVGFNRRFAPLGRNLKTFFADAGRPIVVSYRINAGDVPPTHWVNNPAEGGGRVVGEVCHFVDFMGWLVDAPPLTVTARMPAQASPTIDNSIVIVVSYADGSIGTIIYVTTGGRALAKEWIEVHGGGRSAVLDDFRKVDFYRDGRRSSDGSRTRQDKGHHAECQAFLDAIRRGAPSPIPFSDLLTTTRLTFLALESAHSGGAVLPVPA